MSFSDVTLGKESVLPNQNDMRWSKANKCT